MPTIPKNLLDYTRHRTLHQQADDAIGPSSGADGQFLQKQSGLWLPRTLVHSDLGGVSADQHHARDHSITGATHTSFPGGTTNFLRADGSWAAPSGGGGGSSGAALLPLDVPPGSAHAKDDEFNGSSLDAKWLNPVVSAAGFDLALSVANGWLQFEPNTSGIASTGKRGGFGIRQAAPTGSFTVSAKVVNGNSDSWASGGDDARLGIFVARTTGGQGHVMGAQDSQRRFGQANGFSSYSETAEWGAYDGYDQFIDYTQNRAYMGTWYRIKWDSSAGSLKFYFSTDGVFWTSLATRTGQSQPDRIGIVIWANSQNIYADHRLGCDWFRVTEP